MIDSFESGSIRGRTHAVGPRNPSDKPARAAGTARRFRRRPAGVACLAAAALASCAAPPTWLFSATPAGGMISTAPGSAAVVIECLGDPAELQVAVPGFARTPGLESLVVRTGSEALVFPLPVTSGGPVRGRVPLTPAALALLESGSPLSVEYGKQATLAPPVRRADGARLYQACLDPGRPRSGL